MTTPVTVRPTSTTLSTTARPSFASGDGGFRQDDEIGGLAVFDAFAQRACRSEIEIQFGAGIAFKLGAERRYHRFHGARAHDLDFSHVTSIVLGPDRGRAKAVRLGADAFNDRAAAHEFFLEPLKAAIEMIDAVDHGLALRCKGGNHKRHRGTEVSRHHRRALEAINALDRSGLTVKLNARAKARKLLHMHEAVFEDRLRDTGRPF